MKPGKRGLFVTASLILALSAVTSNAVASRSPGVPAGMIMMNGADITVMGFNISSDIPREDVDDLYQLASGLLAKLGGGDAVTSLSPSDLENAGITTGDGLHSLLVANLDSFKRYLQIDVLTITSPVAGYRIEIYMWDNDQNSSGTYMAGIEIPQELPLMDLLGIMETGTHNMKIYTTANETTQISRMSFYYQEASASEEVYVASIEITALLMQTVLMSLM